MNASRSYLIAEDEPLPAQTLLRQLQANWSEAHCVGVASDGDETLSMIELHRPDVVFLDVRMPHRDGVEIAHTLCRRQQPPLTVFVTAYSEYALQAFDEAALDYLLKPIDPERLARCVERLRQFLSGTRLAPSAAMLQALEHLLARRMQSNAPLKFVKAGAGATVRLVPVEEILWFEAADKYITVATLAGDRTIRMSLRELLAQLDSAVFWQVHRGIIVNTRHVLEATHDGSGQIALAMRGRSERLQVSRQFAHLFRRM